ncbi:hypothetical protein RI367_004727 [Sorochytrium milnesiophthora]
MTLIQENVIVQNTASGNNIDQNIAGDHSLAVQAAHGHVAGFEPIVVNESYSYNGDVVQHNVVVQNAASGDNIHQNAAGDNSLAVQQQHWTPEQIHAKEVYQQSMDQYHAGTGNVHVQENVITQNAASGTNIHQNAAGNDSAAVQDAHSGSHLYQASHLESGYHAQDNTITQNSASGWHINQNAAGNDSTAVQAVHHDSYNNGGSDGTYDYQYQHHDQLHGQDNSITQNTASGEHINQNAAGNHSEAGQWVHHDELSGHKSDYHTYDHSHGWSTHSWGQDATASAHTDYSHLMVPVHHG